MIGALAPAIPEAAVGAANGANTTAVFFGHDPRRGRDYVYLETLGGGFGGRFTRTARTASRSTSPTRRICRSRRSRSNIRCMVESYGFVADSGGAGRHRGGLGLRRVVRPVGHTMVFTGQGERFTSRPWGIFRRRASGGTGKLRQALARRARRCCRPSPRTSQSVRTKPW